MDSLPSVENDNSKDEKSKRTAEGNVLSEVFDDHDTAAFDLRVLTHTFPALALVENLEELAVCGVQVQFPRAVRSIEITGVLLHVALERSVQAVGHAAGMNE